MQIDNSGAQAVAHPAQTRVLLRVLCAILMVAMALEWNGCAAKPKAEADTVAMEGVEADGTVFAGQSWYVFRFSARRYMRLTRTGENLSEDSLGSPSRWLEIGSPGGSFRPVQAVQAMQGNFYLVDAAQSRLCLYDSGAQLLSTFPLPAEIGTFIPGAMGIFRGGGGAFTFLNYQTGESKQFVDRTGGEGGISWILRSTGRLPIGLKACIQEPEGFGLSCVLPEGPMRFDPALNRIRPEESYSGEARLFWDAAKGRWTLEADASGGKVLFQFLPLERRLKVSGFLSK